ncbi:MAG: ATPase [Tannerellaceae bacterium]|jgi:V/A-type H+-transporting ATPase subunit I|nr:ATPase [Tannerellaceae bacterium]
MIIKMKKYAFMVYHQDYDRFLRAIRDLRLVHINETKSVDGLPDIQAIQAERKRVAPVLASLKAWNSKYKDPFLVSCKRGWMTKERGFVLLEEVEEAEEKRTRLQAQKQALLKDIASMEPWGEFSYDSIRRLEEAGYAVDFFTCPTARFDPAWTDSYNAVLINSLQSVTFFITVTKKGTRVDIDAERPRMPACGLAELKERYEQLKADGKQLEEQYNDVAHMNYCSVIELDKILQDEFNLANVFAQTDRQAGGKLMLLEGWITAENAKWMEIWLTQEGFFFYEEEIEEGDKVPVKLRNNSYSRLFEPITRMYSLPGYTELDPTPLLAPFFMLFFGLCFGDGGYGLIILLACTFLKETMQEAVKPYLTLFQWLGGTTIVVGILTGSFFGISLAGVEMFKDVKDYFLNSDNLMTLSVVIGLVHILFGKAVAAYKTKIQRGVKHSLAPFAWVFVLASLLCVAGLPALDIRLPGAVLYIMYGIAAAGALIVLFYNSPGKNVLLNFGAGLWNTYNVVFGMLGDTLSYIRLFAVGLTGSILGGVFNSLAITMTADLPWAPRFVCMLLILLFGHGLNFGLCMISSLVHPVRLIFVEYFKNSEFEGGSKAYTPYMDA